MHMILLIHFEIYFVFLNNAKQTCLTGLKLLILFSL